MPVATDLFVEGPNGKLSVRTKGMEAKPANVVICIQGANLSGQTGYDFHFPGGKDYSLMDAIVARGLGAITFALSGSGKSDPPRDPVGYNTQAAIEDCLAVMDWAAEQGYPKPFLFGWSWGARMVLRICEDHADRIARIVSLVPGFGGGNPVLPAPTGEWIANTRADYLARLPAEFTDENVRLALADRVEIDDPRLPAGVQVESATVSRACDPTKVTRPTLLIYGSEGYKAGYHVGAEPRAQFLERMATDDKGIVIIPDSTDYVHFQRHRRRFHKMAIDFFLEA
jgi:pimeloyl-ACP methyl ester carboxylesterase